MTKRISLVCVLLAGFAVAACDNTVRGVGRDVQETGQAVQDVAN